MPTRALWFTVCLLLASVASAVTIEEAIDRLDKADRADEAWRFERVFAGHDFDSNSHGELSLRHPFEPIVETFNGHRKSLRYVCVEVGPCVIESESGALVASRGLHLAAAAAGVPVEDLQEWFKRNVAAITQGEPCSQIVWRQTYGVSGHATLRESGETVLGITIDYTSGTSPQ